MSRSACTVNRRRFLEQTSAGAVVWGAGAASLAGLATPGTTPVFAQAKTQGPPNDRLVQQQPRTIATLPLNPNGSAKEFSEKELTPLKEIGVVYRNTNNQPPAVEFDPAKHKIRIRGNVMKLHGAMGLADLEALPRYTQISKMQCGGDKPSGIIKWSGVRFADVCRMLQTQAMCHYVMFVAADKYVTTEEIATVMHPQTILAWQMNDATIPPEFGAPYRLVIPFRWAARHIKAITEIRFTATSFGYNNS